MALNLDKTGSTRLADTINNYLNAGNHYIYFPEGLYYIDKPINLPSDTLIEAHPNARFYDPNYRTTSKHRFFFSQDKFPTASKKVLPSFAVPVNHIF